MENGFIWVTVSAIAILTLCIIVSQDHKRHQKLPSNMCLIAIAAMLIGIFAGPQYQMVAYTLIGMSVLLGFMNLIIN